jgi:hypothetical protein
MNAKISSIRQSNGWRPKSQQRKHRHRRFKMKYGESQKSANKKKTGVRLYYTEIHDVTPPNPRMTQLQMRCHSLQERFEDQSATLKLARESHGDMQVTFDLYEYRCIMSSSPSGAPDHSGGGLCGESTSFRRL